ncbi:MAG: AbrB/MazE/SpoVT family DNA-binding domain-containing protein [Candidatus Helarchaeota archaeon]
MSSKGQVVIPKGIRETLELEPGSKFNVKLEGKKIILEPITDVNFEELIIGVSDKEVSKIIKETKKLELERERRLLKELGVE